MEIVFFLNEREREKLLIYNIQIVKFKNVLSFFNETPQFHSSYERGGGI